MAEASDSLTKVDSAVSGLGGGAKDAGKNKKTSSSTTGVYNINDLGLFNRYTIAIVSVLVDEGRGGLPRSECVCLKVTTNLSH